MNQTILKSAILHWLSLHDGYVVNEIATDLGYHRPSVSRALHQLQRTGYVIHQDKKWLLTEKGKQAVLLQEEVYIQQIVPLVEKVERLAKIHKIPFLTCFEVDGWLHIRMRLEDSGSEIRSAYGELTGDWSDKYG